MIGENIPERHEQARADLLSVLVLASVTNMALQLTATNS